MSNTDWYAQVEAAKPWNAFRAYQQRVNAVIATTIDDRKNVAADTSNSIKSSPASNVVRTVAIPEVNHEMISRIAALGTALLAKLPERERKAYRHCYGLPRAYPKMWMATPHSNSLMFEFKTFRRIPSNGLKSWKD